MSNAGWFMTAIRKLAAMIGMPRPMPVVDNIEGRNDDVGNGARSSERRYTGGCVTTQTDFNSEGRATTVTTRNFNVVCGDGARSSERRYTGGCVTTHTDFNSKGRATTVTTRNFNVVCGDGACLAR